jgi:hypothetical protein
MGVVRVKVPTQTLIASAEKALQKAKDDHAKALADYAKGEDDRSKQDATVIQNVIDGFADGTLEWEYGWHGEKMEIKLPRRIRPKVYAKRFKPVLDVEHIERDLRVLRASSQDEIAVSTESNWSYYL